MLLVLAWLGLILLPWGPGWSGLTLYALLGLSAGSFVVGYAAAKEVVAPGVAGMAIALVNGVRRYAMADYRNGFWLSCGFALLALVSSLTVRETRCPNLTVPDH